MDKPELFRRQWVRWQPLIYGYIRTMVFHRADAEDVLQDVAEVLWRKIDQFQEGTRFDQWAYHPLSVRVRGESPVKSLVRILVVSGAVTLANVHGSVTGGGNELLVATEQSAPVKQVVRRTPTSRSTCIGNWRKKTTVRTSYSPLIR